MKNAFKLTTILCLAMLAGAIVFCKKETAPQPEQRWLRIYRDGEFEDSINVTGWEVNEDIILLVHFYYPWQGEDSIDYDCYDPYHGNNWDDFLFLNVNGRLVGIHSSFFQPCDVPHPEKIITAWHWDVDTSLVNLKGFPNLIVARIGDIRSKEKLKILETIPPHVRLFLDCNSITNADLKGLSKFNNIRGLYIISDKISNRGLRRLCKLKELRILKVISETIDGDHVKCIDKLKKLRVWYLTDGIEID